MTCIVSRRVRIPKKYVDLEKLSKDLVIVDTRDSAFVTRNNMVCFQELKSNFIVPKAYGIDFIKRNNLPFEDINPEGEKVNISFKGELREAQKPVVAEAMIALQETEGAVLNLFCGFGKTTCANMISCQLSLKTLVLVHTSALADQWKDRIEHFVENSSVGMIRQSTFDVEGRTHVVGLMQSISKRNYGEKAFDSFGLMIIDECHHVCAEQLSKCIRLAGTKYRLGLSATPFRKDGFHPFLWFSIGNIAKSIERNSDSQELLVEAVLVASGPSTVHTTRRAGGKQSVNMSRMVSDLCEDESRGRTQSLAKCIKNKFIEGRHVIVLSDRRGHLILMAETLRSLGVTDIGFMVGGQKSDVTKKAEANRVIFATYSFTSEGVDIPSLDTAIFATPRSDVVQTTGRILRSHEFKKTPLVVDFVDAPFVFRNQFKKRKSYYNTLGGEIDFQNEDLAPSSWGEHAKSRLNKSSEMDVVEFDLSKF